MDGKRAYNTLLDNRDHGDWNRLIFVSTQKCSWGFTLSKMRPTAVLRSLTIIKGKLQLRFRFSKLYSWLYALLPPRTSIKITTDDWQGDQNVYSKGIARAFSSGGDMVKRNVGLLWVVCPLSPLRRRNHFFSLRYFVPCMRFMRNWPLCVVNRRPVSHLLFYFSAGSKLFAAQLTGVVHHLVPFPVSFENHIVFRLFLFTFQYLYLIPFSL